MKFEAKEEMKEEVKEEEVDVFNCSQNFMGPAPANRSMEERLGEGEDPPGPLLPPLGALAPLGPPKTDPLRGARCPWCCHRGPGWWREEEEGPPPGPPSFPS